MRRSSSRRAAGRPYPAGLAAAGLLLLGFVLLPLLWSRLAPRLAGPPAAGPVAAPAATPAAAPVAPAAPAFDPGALTLRLEPAARGLTAPLAVVAAGDGSGRLYVAEKGGTVRLVEGGAVAAAPFLDVRRLVRASGSEQGLLGLAFHPRYRQNGYLYVNYTDTAGHTAVVRYTARADRGAADPGSAQPLLRVEQPAANHNGGHLLFGPDGYLYVGLGDGGGAGDTYRNAQSPQSLLGKMLRLDVDRTEGGKPYAIPADNPYRDGPFRPEVWALGLRNPWRYSFDRTSGDLYIADVGQNAYEEVNVVPAGTAPGLNFGWPRMEGTHCYPSGSACDRQGLTLPATEYGRGGNCSVTGGAVYRGTAQPLLRGAYLFGDYCSGRIWSLHRDGGGGAWVQTELLDSDAGVSSFGEDEAGELYLTGLSDGVLYRIVAAPR